MNRLYHYPLSPYSRKVRLALAEKRIEVELVEERYWEPGSELLRRTLGEGVQLETVLAGGLWPVLADANILENAVLNLAINARDAMPAGGRLTLETANCHLDDAYAAEHTVDPGQHRRAADPLQDSECTGCAPSGR